MIHEELIEEWRPVIGYQGQYEVSNFGNIRRLEHKTRMKNKYGKEMNYTVTGKRMNFHIDPRGGYFTVSLKRKVHYVHRLVAKAFILNHNNKPFINHKDNDRKNNYALNLEWCTQSENLKHAGRQGRLSFTNNKLTVYQVHEIRNSDKNIPSGMLCKQFSVSSSIIRKIRQGKLWAAH